VQTTDVPEHDPALHRSFVVQAFPSSQEFELLVCTHPVAPHVSLVHGLLSLQLVAVPPAHDPALHRSFAVQALPSVHVAVLFAFTHPEDGAHESSVHTFPSLQFRAAPARQIPAAHRSFVVQALPSLHDPLRLT